MFYWLFTDGRELLSSLLILLSCLALLMPLIVSAIMGAGIQRSSKIQGDSGWKRIAKWLTIATVLLAVTTIYLMFLSDMAIQPIRGKTTANSFIRLIVGGPENIHHMRLFMFEMMLAFLWMLVTIGLQSGLKNGGWFRERVDRLRTPRVKRGALGSSHFCSQREYKRFRREDEEGLVLFGAFWGENKQHLDLGTGRFCLSGEDISRGILTLGGPGSGKTQGIILPAIADRMLSGHSLIVADPQGEITAHILKYAAVTRHLVVVHDPTSTIGPRYNLAEGIDNVSDARAIADVLVPEGILVDPEAGRIARLIGQFGVYRAWVFAHSTDDGDGWVERKQLEDLWQTVGVAKGKHQARRIIQRGINQGYWTQDKKTKRIYLFGQVRITTKLVEEALDAGYHHLIETNKLGKRRIQVNLAGTLQEASPHLYASWLVAKDPEHKGTTVSRDMLCNLWQVSVPTLLIWEEIAGIGKQANFAQSNDTSPDNVPAHAYLTLNRDGTTSAAWRLPNTYYVNNGSIQQHSHTGKATHIKQAVRVEISLAEQHGSIGDAALPRSGKRYFTDSDAYKVDAFKACGNYLRKLSRINGNIFQRRYFYVGSRHGVHIYEPYNIQTNTPETNIFQRLI